MNPHFLTPICTRPQPYIPNRLAGYMYNTTYRSFSKITVNQDTSSGSCEFTFCDTGKTGNCGWQHVYLLSVQDIHWIKDIIERFGIDLYNQLYPAARNDKDAALLVGWIEIAKFMIQQEADRARKQDIIPSEFNFDHKHFFEAVLNLEL